MDNFSLDHVAQIPSDNRDISPFISEAAIESNTVGVGSVCVRDENCRGLTDVGGPYRCAYTIETAFGRRSPFADDKLRSCAPAGDCPVFGVSRGVKDGGQFRYNGKYMRCIQDSRGYSHWVPGGK